VHSKLHLAERNIEKKNQLSTKFLEKGDAIHAFLILTFGSKL
jgi:hypothetical protein